MQLQIESTDEVVVLQGVDHRVWRGITPMGVECFVLVRRIAVRDDLPNGEFECDPHLVEKPKELDCSGNPRVPF